MEIERRDPDFHWPVISSRSVSSQKTKPDNTRGDDTWQTLGMYMHVDTHKHTGTDINTIVQLVSLK